MSPADVRGRFLWHELLTTDPEAASRFYGGVAGWETIRWDQDSSYRLLATAGVPMAGLVELPAEDRARGAVPRWITYIGVPDVDAAVRLATGMGATVRTAAHDVPTVGRMAELADPQGAVFSVYTPTGDQVPAEARAPGDFSWHELATSNWQAAWEFYGKVCGWEYDSSFDMGPAGTYWMFRRPGAKQAAGGMYTKQPDQPGPPHWLPYVVVASADRAAEAATRSGGRIAFGPTDVPGGDGRFAIGIDPQGAAFAVFAPTPAPGALPGRRRRPRRNGRPRRGRRRARPPSDRHGRRSGRRPAGRRPGRRAEPRPGPGVARDRRPPGSRRRSRSRTSCGTRRGFRSRRRRPATRR